ncbi:hypothetical protein CLOM621_07756 [Clostridium sp. M62/1]|nr:hypothetical protein CLOM621_07756 [Clostridium sp. M62/1]
MIIGKVWKLLSRWLEPELPDEPVCCFPAAESWQPASLRGTKDVIA